MMSEEKVFQINKVIFSLTAIERNWITKSRVVRVRISIPKQ